MRVDRVVDGWLAALIEVTELPPAHSVSYVLWVLVSTAGEYIYYAPGVMGPGGGKYPRRTGQIFTGGILCNAGAQ